MLGAGKRPPSTVLALASIGFIPRTVIKKKKKKKLSVVAHTCDPRIEGRETSRFLGLAGQPASSTQ